MSIGKRKKQYEGEQGKTELSLPDLFAYLDYRKFLRDYCAAKRAKNTWFSYRYLSGKVGIKSGGFFSWVLQGKRNISVSHYVRYGDHRGAKRYITA